MSLTSDPIRKTMSLLDENKDNLPEGVYLEMCDNLKKLYQQGSLKALMPDFHENLKQLMLINTAGGITSGDEYNYDIEIDKSNLCISTQAAEKIYSGFGNPANLEINLNLINNSSLFWLPKELILFNNCNLKRKLNFNLSKDSNLLLCESIIFGRTSMKEVFEKGYFSDFWNINIDKKLIHTEAINTGLFEKKYLNSFKKLQIYDKFSRYCLKGSLCFTLSLKCFFNICFC